jgi:molybdopterin-containing oxidoreductase family membrane subunit
MNARSEVIEVPFREAALRVGWRWVASVAPLLLVFGWGAYNLVFQQWAHGLEVTGLNVSIYWGLYIVNFVFLVGVSAGGIIVAALAYAAGIERFRPIARIAELMAISCLILATLFIFVSIGAPDRFYLLFLYGRLGSPLIWDVIIVLAYLALALVLGYFGTRADLVRCMDAMPKRRWLYRILTLGYTDLSPRALQRDKKILRALAIISIPAAVLLHSITAWILGLVKARVTWHTSLMGPLFVVSAVVSGLALVILSVVAARIFFGLKVKRETIVDLGKLLGLSIPVLGYFLFAELLTVTFGKEPAHTHVFGQMIWGQFAPLFWVNLVGGLVLPLILLVIPSQVSIGWVFTRVAAATALAGVVLAVWTWSPGEVQTQVSTWMPGWGEFSPPGWALGMLIFLILALTIIVPSTSDFVRVGTAASLVVVGVFLERTNIVVLPQLHRLLFPFYPHGSYTPTVVELSIIAGIYALGALFFALCAKIIPLVEMEEEA